MTELKVFLSPHFSEEDFVEEVSGITFKGGRKIQIHSIQLEEEKLVGIASAVRKNILLPFDKNTRKYMEGFKAEAPKPADKEVEEVKEVKAEEPEAEVVLEAKEAEKAPARKTRKKAAPKKEETN